MPKIIEPPTGNNYRLIDAVVQARRNAEKAKEDYDKALLDAAAARVNLTQLSRYVGISKQALSAQIKKLRK